MIPTEKCIEILDDCKRLGVKAMQFTGGGEPTVHPDHIQIFKHAQDIGLKTALITNGYRYQDIDVYSRFEWIRVSLDAGQADTYQKIRKHSGFFQVCENIRHIADLYKGTLGVGFIVTGDNFTEIVEATKTAKMQGADYIRIGAVITNNIQTMYQNVEHYIQQQIGIARRYEDDKFKVYDQFNNRLYDLKKPDYKFCGYQYFTVYIGGDQKVYRCCTTSYTKHGLVGDLTKQTFYDWATTSDRDFDARTCNICQFNDRNRTISYMLTPNPKHVDFV